MKHAAHNTLKFFKDGLISRLSLIEDKATDEVIDADLRSGIELRGTNLWVLMFAILIASIGLNVNSTAVIIGAMLISPLMGPIIGVGYGVGILDFALIRKSVINLVIAVSIALITSTCYFLISPLTTADTEILARTTPTIWDLLIAFFGGFAGIIAATRKEKSNVIPGVAIATALMPPLCTASFGIAHANWSIASGAFFLFIMNCVFIAFSSSIIIRGFHIQQKRFVDENAARRVRLYVTVVVLATVLPSSYMAYELVRDEVFTSRAKYFVSTEFKLAQSHVTETNVFPRRREIEATLIGEYVPQTKISEISARLTEFGLDGARLTVHQVGDNRVDVSSLKASLLGDLYTQSQQVLLEKDLEIAKLKGSLDAISKNRERFLEIAPELRALFPGLKNILLSDAVDGGSGETSENEYSVVLNASTDARISARDKSKIKDWLKMRTHASNVMVYINSSSR